MTSSIEVADRNPHLVLNAADLEHLEDLAESAMKRHPTLADRFFQEIGRAQILESTQMPEDVVGIGSKVTYRDEATGQHKTVTLVYPEDADITRLRVSIITPIGVALLGLREGASFYWDTRQANQRRTLTILKVEQGSDDPQGGTSR
ncbi:MAG TPA: nucleoside diphosphate kinase regulator [Sulfitobacter sp.]|uniref:nucleoside diphosphate kinase regulator n=1 Tax=Sulfitobacter dubius TaxID=218673 RepID=UPI000C6AB3AA|nr:nucleoside-diphosphate kinase [Sulfitobacter sp.]HBB81727.1 nucleoside diphosphate kinase regulator [Sulfitobacter sp.]